jgi:hypothetical protein
VWAKKEICGLNQESYKEKRDAETAVSKKKEDEKKA